MSFRKRPSDPVNSIQLSICPRMEFLLTNFVDETFGQKPPQLLSRSCRGSSGHAEETATLIFANLDPDIVMVSERGRWMNDFGVRVSRFVAFDISKLTTWNLNLSRKLQTQATTHNSARRQ